MGVVLANSIVCGFSFVDLRSEKFGVPIKAFERAAFSLKTLAGAFASSVEY